MHLICLSASNVTQTVGDTQSTSRKTCELFGELMSDRIPDARVTIVDLRSYELIPCRMCGACWPAGQCAYDESFNLLFELLKTGDALFLAVPHYAPLPAKLMMLCEKLQELAFLTYFNRPDTSFPLAGKSLAIAGHGGMPDNERTCAYYHEAIVKPVAGALHGVGMVVAAGSGEHGSAFGIKELRREGDAILPYIVHDWDMVKERLDQLANGLVQAVAEKCAG